MSANWVRGAYNGSKDDLNSSRPQRQHFDLGLSSRPMGEVRRTDPSALGVNLYVQSLGGDEAAPPQATGSLGGCGCADCEQRTGDLDVSGSSTLDTSQYTNPDGSPDTNKILSEAEKRGLDAAQKQSFVADVIRRISVTYSKAKQVANDAETGSEYGSVIPVVGTVAGTIAGAAYGVYDQFGDDIKSALSGGPRWSEDQYNTMRTACRNSGGVSVPGRPPNNLDSCQYPDGTLSGGDTPVWAGQSEYEADQATRAANLTGLSNYIDGLKRIDVMIAKADMAVRNASKVSGQAAIAARNTWMRAIGNAFGTVYNATKPDGAAPANVAGFLADISPRVYMPPMLAIRGTAAQAQAAASRALASMAKQSAKQPQSVAALAGKLRAANIPPMISATVGSALAGNQAAAVSIRNTVDAARAGDAGAINDARLMSHAQRIVLLHSFVVYYGVQ